MLKREYLKKSPDELQEYLHKFRNRGFYIPPKKGKKAPYSRKTKHKNAFKED